MRAQGAPASRGNEEECICTIYAPYMHLHTHSALYMHHICTTSTTPHLRQKTSYLHLSSTSIYAPPYTQCTRIPQSLVSALNACAWEDACVCVGASGHSTWTTIFNACAWEDASVCVGASGHSMWTTIFSHAMWSYLLTYLLTWTTIFSHAMRSA